MKKLLALLMALVLCFSFAACGNEAVEEPDDTTGETTEEKIEIAWEEIDGKRVIPESEFAKCLKVVTLTEDNWQDYLKVMTVEHEVFDSEGVSTLSYEQCVLGVEGKYYYLADFAMSLKLLSTGYVYQYTSNPTFYEKDLKMEDLECLSVSGTLIILDIPLDVISIHPITHSYAFYVGAENTKTFHIIDNTYIYGDDLGEFWK